MQINISKIKIKLYKFQFLIFHLKLDKYLWNHLQILLPILIKFTRINELLFSLKSSRNSHQKCSVGKGVLRNFANSQENTCARVPFLIKLQA